MNCTEKFQDAAYLMAFFFFFFPMVAVMDSLSLFLLYMSIFSPSFSHASFLPLPPKSQMTLYYYEQDFEKYTNDILIPFKTLMHFQLHSMVMICVKE